MTIGPCFKLPCKLVAVLLFALLFVGITSAQTKPQITHSVDPSQRTMLANTVHPLATTANDRGRADSNLAMKSMILMLQPGKAQKAAAKQTIDNLHNASSPSFHKWLTPEQYAAQFGAADEDVQTVSGWLTSSGFSVEQVARGKNWVRFSGTAGQVENAFQTEIHSYSVNGESHYANASALSIPAALAPAVTGVVSANNFLATPQHVTPAAVVRNQTGKLVRVATPGAIAATPSPTPAVTTTGSQEENYLGPADFATIYNTQPLLTSGNNGAGVSIAVVGRSDINMSDVEAFRTVFGLPFNDPNIIYATTDPGDVYGDDVEATLDVEWSGAVAPQAKINLVIGATTNTTDGLDIAASYAVDNVTAPILSVSFGECEANMTPGALSFYQELWQQAAAEGITVFVAAGDSGSSSCNAPTNPYSTSGLAVSGLASSAYDVAVGGTEFNESNPNTYWTTTNGASFGSAIGYIPEAAWNESCNGELTISLTNCNFAPYYLDTYAGGGGASSCAYQSTDSSGNVTCTAGYAKPSWQTGAAVPADGVRDLPDLALAAAAYHDGYLICFQGSCQWTSNGTSTTSLESATIIGGTSAATPSMAGIMALVEQQHGQFQGQANYQFYKLAAAQSATACDSSTEITPGTSSSCVFNDITAGSNAVSCAKGSPDCSTTPPASSGVKSDIRILGPSYYDLNGYNAAPGYDQASGLGSVNAVNLVGNWGSSTTLPSATTLQLSQTTFQHGTPITFNGQVSPASGTGTPTGDVLLTASSGNLATQPLTSGAYSAVTPNLPGGTYNITAKYSGDATYSSSNSSPVSVTISPESSVLAGSTWEYSVFYKLGIQPLVNNSAVLLGNPFWIQVQINGASGSTGATGSVQLLNGTTSFGTYPVSKTGEIYVQCGPGTPCDLGVGTYNFTAKYSGDASFNPSTTTIPFTVEPGILYYYVLVNNQTPMPGQTVIATAEFGGDPAAVPTGTVTLTRSDTGATLGSGTIAKNGVATIPFAAPAGVYTVNGAYTPDSSYITAIQSISQTINTNINSNGTARGTPGTKPTTLVFHAAATAPALGQQTQYTVGVVPTQANASLPTGTVTIYNANGPISAPVILSGGKATGFVQWLVAGPEQVYATYSGDGNFMASNSPLSTVNVAQVQPTLTVQPQASFVAVGGQASVTALLTSSLASSNVPAPTGTIQFLDSLNGGAAQAIGTAQGIATGNGGSLLATLAPMLPTGSNVITAVYSGDVNWKTTTSAPTAPILVTTPGFTATATTGALSVTAGETAPITINTQSILGFSGPIALSCGATLPVGVTCAPTSVAAGGSGTLNLTTVAPGVSNAGTTASASHSNSLWALSGGITVAGLLLIFVPRRRRFLGLSVMLIGLAFAGALTGCGGSVSMAPTTLVLTSSGTKAASGATVTFEATVQTTNPVTGTVTFYDGTNAIGNGVTPATGVAVLTTSSLAVGTHTITAKFSGDNENSPSTSSDTIEQTITGSFTVTVNAVSGTLNQSLSIPATLQ
jgi:subtilase family serine protease